MGIIKNLVILLFSLINRKKCVDIPAEGYQVLNENKVGPEFVRVRCESSGETDFHAFVSLRDDSERERRNHQKVNVIVLGFSGLSTTSLPRLLPRTWSFLMTDLNGAHMKGYSKVNTM